MSNLDPLIHSDICAFIIENSAVISWCNDASRTLIKESLPAWIRPLLNDQRIKKRGHLTASLQIDGIRRTVILCELSTYTLDKEHLLCLVPPAQSEEAVEEVLSLDAMLHDLKNPLSSVLGFSDVLLESPVGEGLTKQQTTILLRMRETMMRAFHMVRNYHVLTVATTKGIAPSTKSVDLHPIIEGVVQNLYRIGGTMPALSLELASEPFFVRAEPSLLERIFANLIGNALKYTPQDGYIRIQTSRSSSESKVHIINSGPLIPEADRERIFSPYVRSVGAEKTAGSGLGLFIVHAITSGIGATLTLTVGESGKDSGNDFCVTFPALLQD